MAHDEPNPFKIREVQVDADTGRELRHGHDPQPEPDLERFVGQHLPPGIEQAGPVALTREEIHARIMARMEQYRHMPKDMRKRMYKEMLRDYREQRHRNAPKRYSAFFFLASLFLGIGLTAVTNNPLPLFAGMGGGFLFFVDPLYDKVMEKIKNW